MELLTDVSHASIPVENLERTIRQNMAAMDIETLFQEEHVFIKRKRVLVFHISSSFIAQDAVDEIVAQTGLDARQAASARSGKDVLPLLQQAAARLDGLPLDAVDTILQGIAPTAASVELIQTLKMMGYKIALVSSGFQFFTDYLCKRLDLDYAFGIPIEIDDDARTIGGEIAIDELGSHDVDAVLAHLVELEGVDPGDVTRLSDEGCDRPPGIRVTLDLDVLLRCFNERVVSRENMLGLLGSFGVGGQG
jgi:phosphoserine phosphatase